MKRVLSGIQPSGDLHLGNYFGMMSRMIKYQEQNDLFCFIVNYHALTTIRDKDLLVSNTLNAAMDFIALGLDPEKSTFWIQSDVPQVCESTWLLSNVVNLGLLDRATSYKDKLARGMTANVGLYSYPILMASDILLFGGEIVPVGKDQKQHLEIEKAESTKALEELKKIGDGDAVFKQAGTVLIKSTKKESIDELEEKIELAKTRATVLDKQETRVKESLKEQEAKITEMMKSGATPPPPAATEDNPRK